LGLADPVAVDEIALLLWGGPDLRRLRWRQLGLPTTLNVLRCCHGLKVLRIDAAWKAAQMVDL
jgi:hypothetical protein